MESKQDVIQYIRNWLGEDNHFDYNIVYYKLKKWFEENQFDIPQLLEDFYRHACDMNKANDAMIEAEDEGNEGAI